MAVIAAYEAGALLNAYRDQFKHGQWEDAVRQIVEQEGLAITLRTCQRYAKVASTLSELLATELGHDASRDPKTTRASLLRILRQRDLLSINKVLAVKKTAAEKSKAPRSKPATTSSDDDVAECEEVQFLTPPAILSAVTEFFAPTRLDPSDSSASKCQLPTVTAQTMPSDASAADQPRSGNVFVHPPLDQLAPFVERTVAAVTVGEADQAIVLVPAVMDADYAGLLYPYARGFLRKRPTFETSTGEFMVPQTAYMLVYVSRNDRRLQEFAEIFGHLSDVYYPNKF